MTSPHYPSALSRISLNGRDFYIRSGSLQHNPVPKQVQSVYSLSGERRRRVVIRPSEWSFRVACRNQEEADYLTNLVSNMDQDNYLVTFDDGITASSYNTVITKVSEFIPVLDNVSVFDVDVSLNEWT